MATWSAQPECDEGVQFDRILQSWRNPRHATHRTSFDPDAVSWRRMTDPVCRDFKVIREHSLLGYDLAAGRRDMLLRYGNGNGHCRRHRQVALTTILVLEGEKHVTDVHPDGSRHTVSPRKVDYAMALVGSLPHLEHGRKQGGTVLLSMSAPDGVLSFVSFGFEPEQSARAICRGKLQSLRSRQVR